MSGENLTHQKNIKLNMSRRIRRTPFTNKVEKCGVSDFTVVNHMLLPKGFKNTVEEDYWHLREEVQVWDVSCQRQVQISGPDAAQLVQKMTPRSIKKMETGKCFYIPIIDETAGMINDPVLLKLDDDMFWISIADSDILLWAKGIALGSGYNVEIVEPDVYPLAIQGPKSEDLLVSIFGEDIKKLKFFNFNYFDFNNTKQLIAKSGYSSQLGFEIYLNNSKLGEKLWDTICSFGKKYNLRPGAPNLIDRIEAGLLSFGNDMTSENSPLECGFEKYCALSSDIDFIGKAKLKSEKNIGPKLKLCGIAFGGEAQSACTIPWPIYFNNLKIGEITSGIYNPSLKVNTGIALVMTENLDKLSTVKVKALNSKITEGVICSLPFTISKNYELINQIRY